MVCLPELYTDTDTFCCVSDRVASQGAFAVSTGWVQCPFEQNSGTYFIKLHMLLPSVTQVCAASPMSQI